MLLVALLFFGNGNQARAGYVSAEALHRPVASVTGDGFSQVGLSAESELSLFTPEAGAAEPHRTGAEGQVQPVLKREFSELLGLMAGSPAPAGGSTSSSSGAGPSVGVTAALTGMQALPRPDMAQWLIFERALQVPTPAVSGLFRPPRLA
jgi:hypothetical protein